MYKGSRSTNDFNPRHRSNYRDMNNHPGPKKSSDVETMRGPPKSLKPFPNPSANLPRRSHHNELILSVLIVSNFLVMSLVVHRQVAPLSSFVRALGALERGGLAPAFDHLVSTHRTLPPVPLSAETTPELPLLLVRHAHVDDAEVAGLGQDLERVREHDLTCRRRGARVVVVVPAVVAVAVARVADSPAPDDDVGPRRRRGRRGPSLLARLLLLVIGPQ